MIEIRITLSEHDEALEKEIKKIYGPYCENINNVEELGDAGTVYNIIILVMTTPGFVLATINVYKLIKNWAENKKATANTKKVDTTKNNEATYKADMALERQIINLNGLTKEEQENYINNIIEEVKHYQ